MEKVNGLKFKDGWGTVCGNNKLSFVRLESWSFRNQRGSTEVCIEQISSSSGLIYSISSHGCEYSLTNMIDLLGLEKRALGERVHKILEFVDSSALCSGVDINETTSASMSPMLVENTGTMTMSSSRYFPSSVTSSSAVMALVLLIAEK